MNEETVIKYLEFLKMECLRHSNDKVITDDEINQLKIEVQRFAVKVKDSSLLEKVKLELSKIDFNLDEENHNHSKYKWLNFIGGSRGREEKEQINRKRRFQKLYADLDSSLFKIKSIL